jgi:CMP-N-acetylneuraminic acid synthetase
MDNVLCVVTAREGSKGLPNKNIKELCGKPLISWVVDEAKKSKSIDKLILSTDSDKIIDIMKDKIEIPFKRPKRLSGDNSSIIDVLKHAKDYFDKRGKKYKYILLLQPTSPFTLNTDIEKSIELVKKENIDTLISGYKLDQTHPDIMFFSKNGKIKWYNNAKKQINRQNLSELYIRSGNIYLFKSKLLSENKIYGDLIKFIEIPKKRAISIDDIHDFNIAKFYINEKI